MFISHITREEVIPNPLPRIEPFPSKIFSLETTIVGESQENLGSCISMDESSSFIGFQLDKGMEILHVQVTFHLEFFSMVFKEIL